MERKCPANLGDKVDQFLAILFFRSQLAQTRQSSNPFALQAIATEQMKNLGFLCCVIRL